MSQRDRCLSIPFVAQSFRSEVANNSNRVATSFFGLIKGGHCVDKHVLRCDIGRGQNRSRCHGVTSEVVTRSLSARCKRGSKKPPLRFASRSSPSRGILLRSFTTLLLISLFLARNRANHSKGMGKMFFGLFLIRQPGRKHNFPSDAVDFSFCAPLIALFDQRQSLANTAPSFARFPKLSVSEREPGQIKKGRRRRPD